MNETQYKTLLRSIAISSGITLPPPTAPLTQNDRTSAYNHLEQFKRFSPSNDLETARNVVSCSMELLSPQFHVLEGVVDVTTSTKLYALGVLSGFIRSRYYTNVIGDADRLQVRNSVLNACRMLIRESQEQEQDQSAANARKAAERNILISKLASLLSDITVRDFPQRWNTFHQEVLGSTENGGLWDSGAGGGEGSGTRLCLECLSFVVEDCTDSDFNTKIATNRRNDVLIGLNEISSHILPPLFTLFTNEYNILSTTKQQLSEMNQYLSSQNRSIHQMTPEEKSQYGFTQISLKQSSTLLLQALKTLEVFCRQMPLEWIVGSATAAPEFDIIQVLLFLLRENTNNIYERSVSCLEALVFRKLEFDTWFRLVSSLPQSITDANAVLQQQQSGGENTLVEMLSFHRGLSRMLSLLLSAHISHITTHKDFLQPNNPKSLTLSAYMRLLTEMLDHPSGHICSEQINTWIALLRDPQIIKTTILTPFLPTAMEKFMIHVVRIRWSDVEEMSHSNYNMIDASWGEEDSYDAWIGDYRSKTSQLFKFIANTVPKVSTQILNAKMRNVLNTYNEGPAMVRDHLDEKGRLTQLSEANMMLDGVQQPLTCVLQGVPSWCMMGEGNATSTTQGLYTVAQTKEIRASVRQSLSELANSIVSWSPNDAWLRHHRSNMLSTLKFFWKYDPSTLLSGVDSLLVYLSATDDDQPPPSKNGHRLSGEVVGLRKKAGVCLISISKHIPHLLVPWLAQLSERARTLLSSDDLLPPNRMHLYEFLSCVANAVEEPVSRANFISDVLSNALFVLDTDIVKRGLSSTEEFMVFLGIAEAGSNPTSVTNELHVKKTTDNFCTFYSALNQLLSVGKRCHEAAKKRPNGGIPLQHTQQASSQLNHFPDEGPVSIQDLAYDDPFVPLWPKILPTLIQSMDVILRLWHSNYQSLLLSNPIQCYAYAISDDEAYLAKKQDTKKGGIFGDGGTAGSVVSGWDRRDLNLVPRWSGWLNEFRNVCFQLLGLLTQQRVLFAPEIAGMVPRLVEVLVDAEHLRSMEHRHITQYMKQFIEQLLQSCPSTLYQSHTAPILAPLLEHLQYRLHQTWAPILSPSPTINTTPLTTSSCKEAALLASRGGEEWLLRYYARGGLCVGDLDSVTGEAAVEKVRVDFTRTFSDVFQSGLALKGDWALILANLAKETQAHQRNDPSKLSSGPKTILTEPGIRVNADGSPRNKNQDAIEARRMLRINGLCHFLLLENERIATCLVSSIIQCLGYPDAYTTRRCTKICHRFLETVASQEIYTSLLGKEMFSAAVKAIVTEPKWMVGIEWDMIALVRDIYCRLVLGQTLLPGGQGAGLQQPRNKSNPRVFEQAKSAGSPLQGGGLLCVPSDLPMQVLAGLPGVGVETVNGLNLVLNEKCGAKDQKDSLRDLLRVAAENLKQIEGSAGNNGVFGRAVSDESVLNQKVRDSALPNIPEKLVTHSQLVKAQEEKNREQNVASVISSGSLGNLFG